ncbi:acyltransferase family protein [Acinetobacter sp. 197]|uniref:acyltransferase family protein n=1 Tax=Acinetobacter sp. 197 TaxID=3114696 RepID=UPI003A84D5F6
MERNLSLDILKIFLAFFVVFLHTKIFLDISQQTSFILVQGLFRIAVPLFLIITGYYFFLINSRKQFIRWLSKVLILYIIWSLFYSPFWISSNIYSFIFNILNGYYVLWYLSGTAISGCLLYALRNIKSFYLISLTVLLFFFGCILQTLGNMHILSPFFDKLLNFNPVHRNFLFVCFPFLTMGYLINKHNHFIKDNIKIKAWMIPFLILLIITESLINFNFISNTEGLDQLFSLLLVAPLIFLFFLNLNIKGKSKNIATLSTAIYLIHPFFILLLDEYFQNQNTLLSLIVLMLSIVSGFFLVFINKKLKYIL